MSTSSGSGSGILSYPLRSPLSSGSARNCHFSLSAVLVLIVIPPCRVLHGIHVDLKAAPFHHLQTFPSYIPAFRHSVAHHCRLAVYR